MKNMRPFLFLFFLVIATLECLAESRPNIILMMADDQGWGETGCNGHPWLKTSVLDEIAAKGLKLNRFYSASSVCPIRMGFDESLAHDLQLDPKEQTDLASQHPEIVKTMRAPLENWQRSVERSLSGADY